MVDVFISYKKEDLKRVEPIARALAQAGYEVWWDHRIPPGRTYRDVIGAALQSARCVVVVWSKLSTKAQWVLDEADEGKKRGVLLPLMIDDVEIPYGFRQIEAARLFGWSGDARHPEWRDALEAIGQLVGRRPGGPPKAFAAAAPIARPARERGSGGVGGLLAVFLIGLGALMLGGGYFAWQSGWIGPPEQVATNDEPGPDLPEANSDQSAGAESESHEPQEGARAGPAAKTDPAPAPPISFAGGWNTIATFGPLSFRYAMTLTQTGDSVAGAYQQIGGSISGNLEGTLQGRTLTYRWRSQDGANGTGSFLLASDGASFSGPVTFNGDPIAGVWEGRRQ
jgi:hypothetical protein